MHIFKALEQPERSSQSSIRLVQQNETMKGPGGFCSCICATTPGEQCFWIVINYWKCGPYCPSAEKFTCVLSQRLQWGNYLRIYHICSNWIIFSLSLSLLGPKIVPTMALSVGPALCQHFPTCCNQSMEDTGGSAPWATPCNVVLLSAQFGELSWSAFSWISLVAPSVWCRELNVWGIPINSPSAAAARLPLETISPSHRDTAFAGFITNHFLHTVDLKHKNYHIQILQC